MGNEKKLTKQDINKVYFRNLFALQFGWNYENAGSGLCLCNHARPETALWR